MMISAWNLLWIIPLSALGSLLSLAICSANERDREYMQGYNAGYQEAMKLKNEEKK